MRHIHHTLTLLALLLTSATLHAQHAEGLSSLQRAVGYITDHQPDSITVKGARIGQAGSFSVGAVLSDEVLSPYVGCRVVGIRMAAARSLGKSELFLRPVSGGVIGDGGLTKSQRLYEGWNNVFFNGDTSWEIKEGEQLLVGFDYEETEAMVAENTGGLCTVGTSSGTDFLVYGDFGNGTGWYSVNNLGSLCVQLIVDVASLPLHDMQLSYLDTGFMYKHAGDDVEMYVIASNTGREDLDHYTVRCQVDDLPAHEIRYDESLPEQGNAHAQPSLTLPGDLAIGEHHLYVSLIAGDDTQPTGPDATQEKVFYVYDQTVDRQKNYLEVYNTQRTTLAASVNTALNRVAADFPQMALVNTYAPGEPLSLSEANYLHDLYAYTLPSFTSNRSYFPGENYIAYDVNDYAEQYAAIVPGIIEDIMAQDLLLPAFATVELNATYDAETRTLDIDATGLLAEGATEILGTPYLTLLLTEDNVKSQQETLSPLTRRPITQNDYAHQHVLRRYVTPPLGAPVTVNGLSYTAHHTVTLDPAWNANEMTLVGFITRGADEVNDDNVLQMDITNCNSLKVSDLTRIRGVETTKGDTPEYYSIDGRRLDRPAPHGITVVRKGGKTLKVGSINSHG